jgi:2-beta-glucuronyltransferase
MKRVVFVTSHYLNSDRKAGFHWLAEAFWRAGWHVLFFTESLSWLSYLRNDERCKYPLHEQANQLRQARERLTSFVWFTPFHPVNLRSKLANRLSAPVLRLYPRFSLGGAEAEIARADLFVFDSDHGLFLFDRFKQRNPRARFVYRVSDDITMMRHHPLLPAQEDRILGQFDLVSVPSEAIRKRLAGRGNVHLQHHGLDTTLFDVAHGNPYRTGAPNALYVGRHHFDADFMARAVRLLPAWSFHVFGAVGELPSAANLTCHGERPFAELAPYLQHADIGLQCLKYTPGAEAFTDSLKVFQYTYCRLPIVAPAFLKCDRPHVFYYNPSDDVSIRQALLDARSFDRSAISRAEVTTWDSLAARLFPPLAA